MLSQHAEEGMRGKGVTEKSPTQGVWVGKTAAVPVRASVVLLR